MSGADAKQDDYSGRSSLLMRVQVEVVPWLSRKLPPFRDRVSILFRVLLPGTLGVFLAAGMQQALPVYGRLGGASMWTLSALVACYVLTMRSFPLLVALVFVCGLVEDAFSPSVRLGVSSLVYVALALGLRAHRDYPEKRTPADTLTVGGCVCVVSMLLCWMLSGHADANGVRNAGASVVRAGGTLVLTVFIAGPLMMSFIAVGNRVLRAFLDVVVVLFAITVAYFLRHLKPPDWRTVGEGVGTEA